MRWLFLLAVALVVAVAIWRRLGGVGRQRELMLLCEHAGLAFAPLDVLGDTTWLPFAMFGREHSGTENVVWERERGPEIRAFDFWYEDPKDQGTVAPRHSLTCAVAPLGASARPLRISPRDLADDVRAALGEPAVELELEAFNRRFDVECEDERFAVAFLEQRMMEALLALPDGVRVDVNEDVVLLSAPRLRAEEVLRLFDAAVAIEERIPHSLASLFPPRPARGPHEDRWLQGHWSPEPTEA
jgi:hypothetical protein